MQSRRIAKRVFGKVPRAISFKMIDVEASLARPYLSALAELKNTKLRHSAGWAFVTLLFLVVRRPPRPAKEPEDGNRSSGHLRKMRQKRTLGLSGWWIRAPNVLASGRYQDFVPRARETRRKATLVRDRLREDLQNKASGLNGCRRNRPPHN